MRAKKSFSWLTITVKGKEDDVWKAQGNLVPIDKCKKNT